MPQGRVEPGLDVHSVRNVQQGAGGADHDLAGKPAQDGERVREVGTPHVPTGHHSGEHGLAGQRVQTRPAATDQVHRDTVHPGLREDGQRLAEVAEVGRDEQARPVGQAAQPVVRPADRVQLGAGAVRHQRGFVQLHPVDALGGQASQQLGVDVEHIVEPVQRREPGRTAGRRLREEEERHRAHQHRTGPQAQLPRLAYLRDGLLRDQPEPGRGADLRDDVVVVGVEPLRHPQRRQPVFAPGHGEVGVRGLPVPLWDHVEQHRRVQHVVVPREGVGRHLRQARGGQPPPGLGPQPQSGLGQLFARCRAVPVRLKRPLQLPPRSDSGISEHSAFSHRRIVPGDQPRWPDLLRLLIAGRDGHTGAWTPARRSARSAVSRWSPGI